MRVIQASRQASLLALACSFAGFGCFFDKGGVNPDDNMPVDASTVDGPPGAIDAAGDPCEQWSYVPNYFSPCVIRDPSAALVLDIPDDANNALPFYLYDTTSGQLLDPNNQLVAHESQVIAMVPMFRLISVEGFTVEANTTLRVVGNHGLLVASWSNIDIRGAIDVSSKADFDQELMQPWRKGGGANPASCAGMGTGAAGVTDANESNGWGSGGGGGGFGAVGGIGGMTDGGNGGAGGMALGALPDGLQGGCPGGKGGDGTNWMTFPDSGGAGGDGGGALHLTARDSVVIASTGELHAGGAGGFPGDPDIDSNGNTHRVGGGGGGSGGQLGLEGERVDIEDSAVVAANGGGGGGGCNNNIGEPGEDGLLDEVPAIGGDGEGTPGGSGGARDTPAGLPGVGDTGNEGGGGGGGGVGYIILYGDNVTVNVNAIVSPMQSLANP